MSNRRYDEELAVCPTRTVSAAEFAALAKAAGWEEKPIRQFIAGPPIQEFVKVGEHALALRPPAPKPAPGSK